MTPAAAAAATGVMVTGDITDVWEGIIPPHDLLTGGFPCQSFSQRGDQLGLEDTRGQLYKEILRVLTACQPKVWMGWWLGDGRKLRQSVEK